MGRYVNYSGLVIAGIGFFLTRFTVTLALYEDPVQFYLSGVIPLVLGLGLAAFGVALTVADVDPALVRTTALWCVIGAGTMFVLVVLTLVGSAQGAVDLDVARSQAYLSNFLIGGSVGGTLTGLYAARNREQRSAVEQQANRLVTLNRILRHEVLNAVTAIRGYTQVDPVEHPEAMEVIESQSTDIQQTIEEVKYLTRRAGASGGAGDPLDLAPILEQSIETVEDRHSDVSVTLEDVPGGLAVHANDRLGQVFTQLLDNAVIHGNDDTPVVRIEATSAAVAVTVRDEGPGLPENQRRLLETGAIEAFDDPTAGFGLNVVRLLVESYGGSIDTKIDDTGTDITVTLPRVVDSSDPGPNRRDLASVQPLAPHLAVSFVVAILAGIPYGIAAVSLGGSVAGIGVFYGTASPVVGWLTHEFHSVVFGFVYVGLLSVALERYRNSLGTYLGVALVWCLFLWVVAAGLVAPTWLRLLDIPATIPNLSGRLLVSHLAWGLSLGLLTALGYRYMTRWLTRKSSPVPRFR
jgi:two-component system OmpR family sensor kinase